MRICITTIAAFLVSLLLGRIAIPLLRALKAGQSIREIGPSWHNVKAGTPTMGGICFIVAAVVCTLAATIPNMKNGEYTHLLVLGLALAYGAIGFADDYEKVKHKQNLGLTALQKFLLQLVAAALFLFTLWKTGTMTCKLYIPFAQLTVAIPPLLYLIFAAFVLVGCVNAVNLTDGVDGLATGVTMPVMLFFTVTALLWKQTALALVPAALFGALAGFLVYNFHPAKVFMGDTGSLFLGGMVCGLAFALDMPLILILVGLVYLLETLSVILQVGYFKLTHGKRIFKMTPIHHHFEMSGWSEVKIFTVFVLVTVVMCVLAYLGVYSRY